MNRTDSPSLLRDYTENGSEWAFRELVSRYVGLVYSTALRRLSGDRHLAEDVAQRVFTDLARKGHELPADTMLGGWLHRHTCFIASTVKRSETRRQARERLAVEMDTLESSPEADWKQIAPVLDEAVEQLEQADREAIVLRYFEQCDFRDIGAALGTSDDAAQKRVSRALEKLRVILGQRGVALSLAALATGLARDAMADVPTGMSDQLGSQVLLHAARRSAVLAGVVAFLTQTGFKALLGTTALLAILTGLLWYQGQWRKANQPATGAQRSSSMAATSSSSATIRATAPIGLEPLTEKQAEFNDTNSLRLAIVAADSGKPVPNVTIDLRRWEDREFTRKELFATRAGLCKIPFLRETTMLELTTRLDGFADTCLVWRPSRGEVIPTHYTLRLTRPTRIGGRVVDPDGVPVAGAHVGFNHEADPVSDTGPENHLFGWIQVTTDANGRWTIHRIANEMIRRLYGSARHSNYVHSPMLFVAQDPSGESALREGNHVFQLGRSITIRGSVVGPEGEPIAEAKILVGGRSELGRRALSAADGTFAVSGCKPGKNLVTAETPGFAASTIEVNVSAESDPIRLSLQRGKTLLVRVINRAGQPVPQAQVWLNTFDHGRPSPNKRPPVQAEIENRTDDSGRLIWEMAPDQELTLVVAAEGYMRLDGVKVRPDSQERVVTLTPALTISGTVRDAENGQPIPRFRIVCGWPEGTGEPQWSSLDRFWLKFTGGEFRHRLEESVLIAEPPRDFVFKFEAEGYAPFVSHRIPADAGASRLEVNLIKANDTLVTVLSPKGRPATTADVGLISPNSQLSLVIGGFSRTVQNLSGLKQTDDKGQFRLPLDPSIVCVMVACQEGFARTAPDALTNDLTLRLQAWGRIEGMFRTNGQPAVGQEVQLQFIPEASLPAAAQLDSSTYQVATDVQGRFVFPQAPPGRLTLIHRVPQNGPEATSWARFPLNDVEVRPGQTTHLEVGGDDRTFTLRLRWPEDLPRQPGWNIYVTLRSFLRPITGVALDSAAAFEIAFRTPLSVRSSLLTETSDGIWSAANVAPGEYIVDARVVSLQQGNHPVLHAVGQSSVSIPAERSATPLDLGEIALRAAAQP